jgi:antitoxin (DNA-binding transcriptional repressor) of toxin-antitoxin stability system
VICSRLSREGSLGSEGGVDDVALSGRRGGGTRIVVSAVSVRQFKEHPGEHLRRARAGERITVIEGGRAIAELAPVGPESPTLDERLARLAAAGEITLPRGKKKGRARIQPAPVRGRPVAETLLEDRG